MNASNTKKFFIDGPVGKLETVLAEPASNPVGMAVITHPHTLHGGTMDNKIVYTLFNSVLELGLIAVKFNFRGAGNSEGVYDHGIGEIDDVITVTRIIHHQFDNKLAHLPLCLAGFSFGGAIQLHAAQRLQPKCLILVAPSVENFNAPTVPEQAQSLIIHGEQDDIVPLKTILSWAAPQSLPIVVVPGAAHFFHGQLSVLKKIIIGSCKI